MNIWILKAEPLSQLAASRTLVTEPVPSSANTRSFAGDSGRSSGKLEKVTQALNLNRTPLNIRQCTKKLWEMKKNLITHTRNHTEVLEDEFKEIAQKVEPKDRWKQERK